MEFLASSLQTLSDFTSIQDRVEDFICNINFEPTKTKWTISEELYVQLDSDDE